MQIFLLKMIVRQLFWGLIWIMAKKKRKVKGHSWFLGRNELGFFQIRYLKSENGIFQNGLRMLLL